MTLQYMESEDIICPGNGLSHVWSQGIIYYNDVLMSLRT